MFVHAVTLTTTPQRQLDDPLHSHSHTSHANTRVFVLLRTRSYMLHLLMLHEQFYADKHVGATKL